RMEAVLRAASRVTAPEPEISSILEQPHKESLEFTGILAPVAVDEGHDGSLGRGSDTGKAGGSVTPTGLDDDAGTRPPSLRSGSVGRPVVDHDHLIDQGRGHSADHRPDRHLLVEGGDDEHDGRMASAPVG